MKKKIIYIILMIIPVFTISYRKMQNTTSVKEKVVSYEMYDTKIDLDIAEGIVEEPVIEEPKNDMFTYKITHYGPDCSGCSGRTASGYNVSNTIYYNDYEYGQVRIIAIKDLPLYTIVKIHDYKIGGDTLAIVLDRGVGFGVIDLLVSSESEASRLGIQRNAQVEVLRYGKWVMINEFWNRNYVMSCNNICDCLFDNFNYQQERWWWLIKHINIIKRIKKYLAEHKPIDYEKAYKNEVLRNETLSNDMQGLDSENRLKITSLKDSIKEKDEKIKTLREKNRELKKELKVLKEEKNEKR